MRGGTDTRPGGSWHGNVGEWHGGRWYQGWHGNRYGWWWAVPGYDWYAYDEPAYPYPAYPYTGYPGAPVAPYYWYYCQNPVGYYPYVQQCAGPWQPVPAPGCGHTAGTCDRQTEAVQRGPAAGCAAGLAQRTTSTSQAIFATSSRSRSGRA
jgi:hypothetical protein